MNKKTTLKLDTLNNFSLRAILFISVVYMSAMTLEKTLIISRATPILILSPIIISFLLLWKHLASCNTNNVIYCIFLFFGTLALILSGKEYFYEKMVRLLSFFSIPSTIMLCEKIKGTDRNKKIIYIANGMLACVYIILSFTKYGHIAHGEWGEYVSKTLTLGFSNSNETGMCLMLCIFIMTSAFLYYKKQEIKLLLFCVISYLIYLLFQAESRTCIIVLCAVFLLWFLDKNKPPKKAKVLMIMLVPFLYLILVTASWEFVRSWTVLGEDISTGRENIYSYCFDQINGTSLLIGDFHGFFFQNLHNGYLSIFMTVGVECLVSFIMLLYRFFCKLRSLAKTYSETIAWWGLMGIILHSSAEAAFLTSGVMYASFIGALCVLSKNETEAKK